VGGSSIPYYQTCGIHLMGSEQSSAELLKILQIFAGVTSRCDLDLGTCSTSSVTCANSAQNLSEIEQFPAALLTT